MLRFLRVAVLLYILAFVGVGTLVDSREATNWDYALRVVVYPVPGDDAASVEDYIAQLTSARFDTIEAFFAREARRYASQLAQPVDLILAPTPDIALPQLPRGASRLQILLWSLQMRWIALRLAWRSELAKPDITLFAVYHDGAANAILDNSTALRKGLIAIANLFADRRQSGGNDVVIVHELLHTLGATDKYSLQTLQPHFPDGYAEPDRTPLHPQHLTEIMAGRRAVSAELAEMPASLRNVRVGAMTAHEIGWQIPPQ